MRILLWLKDYWYLPLIAVGAVGWFLLTCRGNNRGSIEVIQDRVGAELEAIGAKREARVLELELGTERAIAEVNRKFTEKRVELDHQQALKAEELEHDPKQLAKYLSRLGRRSRVS